MFRISILSAVAAFLFCTASLAQVNQRTQFNQGLAMFNELVMQHELGEAIDFIQIDKLLEEEELTELNRSLRVAIPDDFVNNQSVRSEVLKNGFRQELLAFWTEENDYYFVYILFHSRKDGFSVIHIEHSTEIQNLMAFF
ncbi:hypothetical protein [Shimia sp. NS0008-38b]|uniref:hypothetical protein n=1 Tax=Shimia sp. NS0008-38b TaxID=3127653 RepID=UPI00333E7AFA